MTATKKSVYRARFSRWLVPFVISFPGAVLAQNSAPPRTATNISVTVLPFPIEVAETPEAKEMENIKRDAAACLKAKDYEHLERMAEKLISSKAGWANGTWKMASVYDALVPPAQDTNAPWETRLQSLNDWVVARPDSASARVALADFLTAYAWNARGSGWADTVTEEGWRLFHRRLAQAQAVLNVAKTLKEKCPMLWSVQMTVALGLGFEKPEFDSIFREATNSAPDYQAYYFHRAKYLLPRWHGDEGEWEADLAKSADRLGGEDGDELYARVVWWMHRCVGFKNIFEENKLSWLRVNRGFEVIEKHFPDSLAAKEEHAHLAVLARDKTIARKYFDLSSGKVDLSAWDSPADYVRLAYWVYGH